MLPAVDHGKSTLTDSLVAAAGIIAMETVSVELTSRYEYRLRALSRQSAALVNKIPERASAPKAKSSHASSHGVEAELVQC